MRPEDVSSIGISIDIENGAEPELQALRSGAFMLSLTMRHTVIWKSAAEFDRWLSYVTAQRDLQRMEEIARRKAVA